MLNLPFFSKANKDSNKFLAITINASSVKCLVLYQDGNNARILGMGEHLLDPGAVRGGVVIDMQNTASALMEAIGHATENINEPVTNAIFGVTGSLNIGLMTTVRVKRGKTPINASDVRDIYNKISEIASIQAQNQYLETTGNEDVPLELITTSTVYSKIDGAYVTEVENKVGNVIETAVFNSYTPEFYTSSLKKLAKECKLNIVAVCSSMYTLVRSLTTSSHELHDFVVIDIAPDATNVSVVFGKGILSTRSLDIGVNHFIEGISQEMGLTLRESERLLKGYIDQHLTQSESVIVQKCLQNVLDIWLSGIELLFTDYTGVKTFAPKVLLTGPGADIPDLWEIISTEPWTKGIPFKSPPVFEKVKFLDFARITDTTGKVSNSKWVMNACLSLAYLEIKGLIHD